MITDMNRSDWLNVYLQNIEEITKLFKTVHNREQCKACWARYFCGGECYGASFLFNGDVNSTPNYACEQNKYIALEYLKRL